MILMVSLHCYKCLFCAVIHLPEKSLLAIYLQWQKYMEHSPKDDGRGIVGFLTRKAKIFVLSVSYTRTQKQHKFRELHTLSAQAALFGVSGKRSNTYCTRSIWWLLWWWW